MSPHLRFAPLLLLGMGCGKATQAARPDEATAAEALGEGGCRCKEGSHSGEMNPLAIDLPATDRAMLEATMKSGVAVVR